MKIQNIKMQIQIQSQTQSSTIWSGWKNRVHFGQPALFFDSLIDRRLIL